MRLRLQYDSYVLIHYVDQNGCSLIVRSIVLLSFHVFTVIVQCKITFHKTSQNFSFLSNTTYSLSVPLSLPKNFLLFYGSSFLFLPFL